MSIFIILQQVCVFIASLSYLNIYYKFIINDYGLKVLGMSEEMSLVILLIGLLGIVILYYKLPEIVNKVLMENITRVGKWLEIIKTIGNIILSVIIINNVLTCYYYLEKIPKETGELVKTTYLTIYKKFGIEEKMEWLKEMKNNMPGMDEKVWEEITSKINLEKIKTISQLKEILKEKLHEYIEVAKLDLNMVKTELMILQKPWYSKITEHYLYDPKILYVLGGIVIIAIGYWKYTTISDNISGIGKWFAKEPTRTMGDVISEGFTVTKDGFKACVNLAEVNQTIVKYSIETKELSQTIIHAVNMQKGITDGMKESLRIMEALVKNITTTNVSQQQDINNIKDILNDLGQIVLNS